MTEAQRTPPLTAAQKRRQTIERREAERQRLEEVAERLRTFLLAEDVTIGSYATDEEGMFTLDSRSDPVVFIDLRLPDDLY